MDKITNIVSVGCSWVAYPYDWDNETEYRLDKINPNMKYTGKSAFQNQDDIKKYSFTKHLGR